MGHSNHYYYSKNKDKYLKRSRNWQLENPDKVKGYHKKWRETEHGQEARKRVKAKRRQHLDWTKLYENPFSGDVEIEWHHVSDEFVVAVPKDIHRLYGGNSNHRELCMNIINQIYLGD
jgi:hypothetical protein